MRTLLNVGAMVNEKDDNGFTALMIASLKGHTEVAHLLIEAGVDINAKHKKGWTEFMCPCCNEKFAGPGASGSSILRSTTSGPCPDRRLHLVGQQKEGTFVASRRIQSPVPM